MYRPVFRRCLLSSCPLKDISTKYSTAENGVVRPKRIFRDPTDILRALEGTITRDSTAAHYKYHDDPYLIPRSNVGKRTFALAQEAGRKAALWVRQEHADLFHHRDAVPPVDKFFPKQVYNEESKVTEEDLIGVIEAGEVTDAITVYNLLKGKHATVSQDVLQSLLELLCFYNSEDTLSKEFIEERWFRQSNKGKERTRKTWKDGGFAEEIFISIDNPNSQAYSAVIQGMVKYYQVDRAWQLFEEAQQKGILVNTDTYNAILNVTNFLKESYEMRWSLVTNLLTDMKKFSIQPNLGTLNAVLHCLSTMGGGKTTKSKALQTIAEFKVMGIEPSLASWYFILNTFCKERGPTSTILYDIMNEIENKNHTICDLRDTNFFVTAMDICRNHLRDIALAKRVDKLLNSGDNYDLIGDSYKESIYYRHYFILRCSQETIDDFMNNFYNVYVPHIYVPEPGVMGEVLNQIEINEAVQYIPQLWSDMVTFDHAYRENLITQILNIMSSTRVMLDAELNERFASVAWSIFEKIEGQPEERTNRISLTGNMIGNILLLVLRGKDFSKACQIMHLLDKAHGRIVGVPQIEALSLFIDACIEEKAPSMALICLQYCSDSGFSEVSSLAVKLNEKLTLDERYLENLSKIINDPVVLSKHSE